MKALDKYCRKQKTSFLSCYNARNKIIMIITMVMTILCQIHKQYDKGWQYSTSIFVGVNSLAVVVIATSYGAMFVNITRTRKRTPDSAVDVTLAKRFFVIVFTNLLCWLPVITVKLVSFLPVNISGE